MPSSKSDTSQPRRFVLLFEGRTGSSYVTMKLRGQPGFVMYGEIPGQMLQAQDTTSALDKRQMSWLDSAWSADSVGDARAIGFKTKLRDIVDQAAFADRLYNYQARLIYLTRRNTVKMTVSSMRSKLIHRSVGDFNLSSGQQAPGPVVLDLEEFKAKLRTRELAEQTLRQWLLNLGRPFLTVFYEQLLWDEALFMQHIGDYLGLQLVPADGRYIKATSDNLRDAVTNYDELLAHYCGTPYEAMIKEGSNHDG